MGKILVAVLGNSDLRLDGEFLSKNEFREKTGNLKEILEKGELEYDRLDFPILKALASKLNVENMELDRTYLVFTDQPHSSDTCNLYGLFCSWWGEKKDEPPWRSLGGKKPKGFKVKEAPYDYDAALGHGRRLADKIARDFGDEGVQKVYISLTGGTPALGVGALLAFIDRWGEKVAPLYVPREDTVASELRLGFSLVKGGQLDVLKELVSKRSYKGAMEVVSQTFPGSEGNVLSSLMGAGYRWVNFDFEGCLRHLMSVEQQASFQNRETLRVLKNELYPLVEDVGSGRRAGALLVNLVEVMRLNLERGQYAYFLGNIFRFHEGFMQYLLSDRVGVQFDGGGKRLDSRWLMEHGELEVYMDGKGNLQWRERDLNRKILRALVGYFVESGLLDGSVAELLDRIEPLAELRNKSIVAHEYQGLNRKKLEERLAVPLEELMDSILDVVKEYLGREPDFLDRLDSVILREIQLKKEEIFKR